MRRHAGLWTVSVLQSLKVSVYGEKRHNRLQKSQAWLKQFNSLDNISREGKDINVLYILQRYDFLVRFRKSTLLCNAHKVILH